MDKKIAERVKETCKKYEVDKVYVTSDGHIFLERSRSLAKDHAIRNKISCKLMNAAGLEVAEKTEKQVKVENAKRDAAELTARKKLADEDAAKKAAEESEAKKAAEAVEEDAAEAEAKKKPLDYAVLKAKAVELGMKGSMKKADVLAFLQEMDVNPYTLG